jgi:hypothetical protein
MFFVSMPEVVKAVKHTNWLSSTSNYGQKAPKSATHTFPLVCRNPIG